MNVCRTSYLQQFTNHVVMKCIPFKMVNLGQTAESIMEQSPYFMERVKQEPVECASPTKPDSPLIFPSDEYTPVVSVSSTTILSAEDEKPAAGPITTSNSSFRLKKSVSSGDSVDYHHMPPSRSMVLKAPRAHSTNVVHASPYIKPALTRLPTVASGAIRSEVSGIKQEDHQEVQPKGKDRSSSRRTSSLMELRSAHDHLDHLMRQLNKAYSDSEKAIHKFQILRGKTAIHHHLRFMKHINLEIIDLSRQMVTASEQVAFLSSCVEQEISVFASPRSLLVPPPGII